MNAKRNAYQQQKNREAVRRFREHRRQDGWTRYGFDVRKEWMEKVAAESARIGVAKAAIWLAIMEVGFRNFRPTDVMMANQRWRERLDLPRGAMIKSGRIKCLFDPVTGRIIGHQRVA